MTEREMARGYAASGNALLTISLAALVVVGAAVPVRAWWLAGGFTLLALTFAWCAGGELRAADEHTARADWLDAHWLGADQ